MNRVFHGLLAVGIAAATVAVLLMPGKVESREHRTRRRPPRPVAPTPPTPSVFPDLPNPIAPTPQGFPGKVVGTWGEVAFVWMDGQVSLVEVREEFRGWRLESCDKEGAVFGNGSLRLRIPVTPVVTPHRPVGDDDALHPVVIPHLQSDGIEGIPY